MSDDKAIAKPTEAGPSFSTEQAIALRGETAALAQAEQAKAAIQARYVMAMRNPRDWDTVRVRLLKECERPGFAEVARYHKPIGKGVEGLSIRFAEAALRCMTNVLAESQIVYEDDEKRQLRVMVTDLEANVTYPTDVMVAKTVERRNLPEGQTALRVRKNASGDIVYLLPATEDDMLNKQNSAISKAIRTGGLRLLPGDIQDECEAKILATLVDRDKADPDAAKKRVLDGLARLGIMPTDVKEYLGHPIEQMVEVELQELRSLYTAIRDGEANWPAAMEAKGRKTGELPKKSPAQDASGAPALDKAAAALGGAKSELPQCQRCGKPILKPSDAVANQDGEGFTHKSCRS